MSPRTGRLLFAGDIALGNHPKTVGFGFLARYRRGLPDDLAARVVPRGWSDAVAFANLEFGLSLTETEAELSAAFECTGLESYAAGLHASGFRALNIANNHIYQHGDNAFARTVDALNREKITVCGLDDGREPTIVTLADGFRVGFLAWCDRPRQYLRQQPPYAEYNHERALRDIGNARSRVDALVASIHWGEEFVHVPAAAEVTAARALVDAGATIVVGHHPHVLRPIERYAHGVIAYSLGNFVSDMTWDEWLRVTGMLCVEVTAGKVTNCRLALARIDDDFLPRFLHGAEEESLATRLQARTVAEERFARHFGYSRLVQRKKLRNQVGTLRFIMRNAARYPKGSLVNLLRRAVRDRWGA